MPSSVGTKVWKSFDWALCKTAAVTYNTIQFFNKHNPNPSFTPKWSDKPLLKSWEKSKPTLGWPRTTDSLCPDCVREARDLILNGTKDWTDLVHEKVGEIKAQIIERDGQVRELRARLVVCADGRSSMGRSWGGFTTLRGAPKLLGAGLLFENLRADPDTAVSMLNPFLGRVAYLFPQGSGRVRAYLMYETNLPRLQGDNDAARFVEECVKTGLAPETYAGGRPAGRLNAR